MAEAASRSPRICCALLLLGSAVVVAMTVAPVGAAHAVAVPGPPELVAPEPGHVFDLTDSQVFTLRVVDPDGDRWLGLIEVVDLDRGLMTTFSAGPGASGQAASGVAVPPLTPGDYRWRARATDSNGSTGPWSATSDFRVGTNEAPAPPTLLAPSDGATLHRLGNAPFSISAVDPDGDAFTGTIVVWKVGGAEVTRFPTSPSVSGGIAFGVLAEPLAAGSYNWAAEATDVHGARSGLSAGRSFTVVPPPTIGGGAVVGAVKFPPPGMAPTMSVCEPSSSTWNMTSAVAVLNTALVGYVGLVDFEGTGTSDCESARFANGIVALEADGVGPAESTLSCSLAGSYTRVETALVLTLSGGCEINHHPVSQVTVVASLLFVPDGADVGLVARVPRAVVTGDFAVVPE